nr:1761_t:CDS:2 [Entrophospora candida]
MVIENQIPIEIKKPTELVSELKDEYKVSSFEEFMKTYEYDDNLNYDDLKEGAKKIVGGATVATGGIAAPLFKVIGKVEQGIGEITNNPGVKAIGEIHDEGANKPAE